MQIPGGETQIPGTAAAAVEKLLSPRVEMASFDQSLVRGNTEHFHFFLI